MGNSLKRTSRGFGHPLWPLWSINVTTWTDLRSVSTKILSSPPPKTFCPFQEELPRPPRWGSWVPRVWSLQLKTDNTLFLIPTHQLYTPLLISPKLYNPAFHGCSIKTLPFSQGHPLAVHYHSFDHPDDCPLVCCPPSWNTNLQQSSTQV